MVFYINISLCKNLRITLKKEYPRVTSFDALKQSTGICAYLITFWFKIWPSKRVAIIYFDRHQFRRLSLAVEKTIFHCSPVFTGCTFYCTRKTKDYQQYITES